MVAEKDLASLLSAQPSLLSPEMGALGYMGGGGESWLRPGRALVGEFVLMCFLTPCTALQ